MYRTQLLHKPQSPKLWEEEWDETEVDFINRGVDELVPDTNILSMKRKMVRKLVNNNLNPAQHRVVEAFMMGHTHSMIGVTEKYWRYHLGTAIKLMRERLVDND